jgi:hydrogenase maturation protease
MIEIKSARIRVVAVGNPLRGDDGVGPAVLERLRENPISGVDLIDIGSDPLDVVETLLDADKVIVIDAARLDREAGHFEIFRAEDLIEMPGGNPFSTHEYGLAEGLNLARALGCLPDVRIIGIQPQQIELGAGLSSAVAARIPDIVKLVLKEVSS